MSLFEESHKLPQLDFNQLKFVKDYLMKRLNERTPAIKKTSVDDTELTIKVASPLQQVTFERRLTSTSVMFKLSEHESKLVFDNILPDHGKDIIFDLDHTLADSSYIVKTDGTTSVGQEDHIFQGYYYTKQSYNQGLKHPLTITLSMRLELEN